MKPGKFKQIVLLLCVVWLCVEQPTFAQCCAGASGSPIAGGTSQGVLQAHQFELNTNFQYIRSDQFYRGDVPVTTKYFERFESAYQYFRVAYGLTPDLTLSLEAGNYFYKREIGLNMDPGKTYESSGIGDFIIFPRYTVLSTSNQNSQTEISLGLGFKIPIGSYNDSSAHVEPFSGQTFYVVNPQAVQLSSGAQDIIFYTFISRAYPSYGLRFFSNMLYVKKSWNPLGEKMGDFMNLGFYCTKSFSKHWGLMLQLRGEWMDQMQVNKDILLFAYPNYDPEATGYTKVFLAPQINYSRGNFTVYVLLDVPVYQYVTKTQVGTGFQMTSGISYRFLTHRNEPILTGFE